MKIYNINIEDVRKALKKANEEVRRYEKEHEAITDKLYKSVRLAEFSELKQDEEWQKEHARDAEICEKMRNAKMTAAYLYDNYLAASMSEYIPVLAEVWNKYAGKRYGAKTEEKIRNEIKDKCGYSVYITEDDYRCRINACNYNDYTVNGLDVTIHKSTGKGVPLEDNVIQAINIEDLPNYHYTVHEDIPAEIEAIRKAYAKATSAFEAAKEALSEYSALVPACGLFEEVGYLQNPLRGILR